MCINYSLNNQVRRHKITIIAYYYEYIIDQPCLMYVLLLYHRMRLQLLMLLFLCVVVMIQAKPFEQVRIIPQ